MRTYKPLFGEDINESAKRMVALAKKTKGPVTAKFNNIPLVANPGDDPDSIAQCYRTELNRRHEEYVKSPECKQQQRETKETQQRHDLMLKGALAVAPEKMTLRDEESWKKCLEVNKDDFYGMAVMRYAERWARLMEGRLAHGDTLEACAEEAASLADVEGMTGFSYGCAVNILSQVWVHGEQLRRWHNLAIQIGNEGEKANESGLVLNPAIVKIQL